MHLLDTDLSKARDTDFNLEQVSSTQDRCKGHISSDLTITSVEGSKETPLLRIFAILGAKDKSDAVVKMVLNVAESILQFGNRSQEIKERYVTINNTGH